jgi:DNA-binding beta-propeller fold protein YncE
MWASGILGRGRSIVAGWAARLLGALAVGVLALVLAAPPGWAGTVYVANLGSEERPGESVSAFSIASGGSLSALAGSPFLTGGTGALGAAVTPDGRYLYVTSFASESVSAFSIGADGSLSVVPGSPFAAGYGPWGVAISPDGGYLYVVDWEGLVSAFSIAADGSLSVVPGSPFATDGEAPSSVAVTPDGGHLYVADQGSSDGSGQGVAAFSIAADGSLSAAPGSPFAAEAPRAMAVTPDGAYLYVADQANGTHHLLAFSIAADGDLSAVPGSPFATESGGLVGVAVSPDGKHLYATNRSNALNTVLAFSIAADGSLSAVPGSPFTSGGRSPNSVAVTPDGRRLYVTNGESNNVSAFSIAADGSLSAVPGSPFATAGEEPVKVVVSPDQGPVAAFSMTPSPAGYPSAFDASASSDADGAVASYRWEFGDGQSETTSAPTTTHTYAAVGPYTPTLTVTDEAGCSTTQTFTGQTVSCNGSPLAQVSHQLTVPTPEPLSVWLGGLGAGTVTSSPPGTACPSTCSYGYAEGSSVTLTATPASGSTFVGWLGCQHLTATECEVTMSEAREVTAVFLKEAEAPAIAQFSGSQHGCANGGLEVTVGGSTTYVCNGADGTNGSAGTNGAGGKEGPRGRTGPQGKEGPRGPAGPPADVTCKVRQQGRRTFRVTCTVTDGASGSGVHLRWRLTRYGRTASRGASDGDLRLDLRHLRPGHYRLYVQGQRHAIAIAIRNRV